MRFPAFLLIALLAVPAAAQQPDREPIDSTAVRTIVAEAAERGQVAEIAAWLTDLHGPRLTGSPNLERASQWAMSQFEDWGLTARLERWGDFGRGWTFDHLAMTARVAGPDVQAQSFMVTAAPQAWSPSVAAEGAPVVLFDAETVADFDQYRGQLAGKVVLIEAIESVDVGFDPLALRRTDEQLLDLANVDVPSAGARRYSPEVMRRFLFNQQKVAFLLGEGPAAVLQPSSIGGAGSMRLGSATVAPPEGAAPGTRVRPWEEGVEVVPQFVLLTEHYNRLRRLVEAGQTVTIDLDFGADYHANEDGEHNLIADLPGQTDELVILGAHLDSWHPGTGATDNAAGSTVVMEAARILAATYEALGRQPRRTVRFALWTGEEQGLFGSIGYVNDHVGTMAGYGQPITSVKEEQPLISAYYNLDNGTGRIRGVYLQGNEAVRPIFRAWLSALDGMGDSVVAADSLSIRTLTIANTGGTDHLPFDGAGVPGFQFVQDPVAYFAQTWHGSMDTYDHLVPEDLQQAATVMAAFAFLTAERDAMLPRKPMELPTTAAAGG